MSETYRVGRNLRTGKWQIKCAPSWKVAYDCASNDEAAALKEAAAWLKAPAQGEKLNTVPVCSRPAPWPMLSDLLRRVACACGWQGPVVEAIWERDLDQQPLACCPQCKGGFTSVSATLAPPSSHPAAISDPASQPEPSSAPVAPGKVLTLEVLDQMPLPRTGDAWAGARQWAQAADRGAQFTLASQAMCGFELLDLRKTNGVKQGKRSDLNFPNGSGSWPELVKKQIGKSEDTARNWMAMADAIKPRLKKLGGTERFRALLETPISEWTGEELEIVNKAVHKLTDGKTQSDFLMELGLAKKPSGNANGGRGKKGGDKEEEGLPAEAPIGWTQAEWDLYLAYSPEERTAVDLWRPLVHAMTRDGLDEKSWAHLPDARLRELKALLIDLNKLIPNK